MFYLSIALSAIAFIVGTGRLVMMLLGGSVTPIGLIISVIALLMALSGVLFGFEKKKYGVALFIGVFAFGLNFYAVKSINPDVLNYTFNYLYGVFPFLRDFLK